MRALVLALVVGGVGVSCGSRYLTNEGPTDAGPGAAGRSPNSSGVAGVPAATGTSGAAGSSGIAGAPGGAGTPGTAGASPPPDTGLHITPNEAVARIVSVLWHQTPGSDLLSAAASASIKTTADLHDIAIQLLADPNAAAGVEDFYRWWLGLDGVDQRFPDSTLFPDLPLTITQDMASEAETFGVNVTLGMNGTFQTLMTAPFSFVNESLALIYDIPGVTGASLRQVALPPGREGLLTQPWSLATDLQLARTRPSDRGRSINVSFFCRPIPSPPAQPPPQIVTPPGVTVRAAEEALTSSAAFCVACHALIDPPGYAFEGFDAVGRARTTDNGAPVDTSNLDIVATTPPDAHVNGPSELISVISTDPGAEDCMARQWLAFVLGLPSEENLDADAETALPPIDAAFAASGFNLKELIAAVVTSQPFLATAR
jgi:hypothetical protein